ncbi:MAG: leucine-rich repeat protein [Bacteroidaceae bacterium]|nr:leucine-rich repeat protein [Bacteroidaceae bacterium]
MKTIPRNLIACIICLIMQSSVLAQTNDTINNLVYRFSTNGEATLTGRASQSITEIYIPATVTYDNVVYPVTAIGAYAFAGGTIDHSYNNITKVEFETPSNVRTIGHAAFAGTGFGTEFYENSNGAAVVTAVGTGLTIPSSVRRIEEAAFNWCGMSSVVFEEGLEYIGKGAFYDCRLALTSVTFPSTLRTIRDYAFMWCGKLPAISLPEGVESIGSFAFAFNYSMKEMHMPSSLHYFGNSVLFNNYQLKDITIQPDCKYFTMGEGNEEGIIFNKDKTRLIFFSAGQQLLGRRYQYKVPTHVKEIGGGAFSGVREELRSIVLPSTLELIDSFAFIQNPLERITIPAHTKLMVGSIPSKCKEIYMMGDHGTSVIENALMPIVLNPNTEVRSYYYGGGIKATLYCKEKYLSSYNGIEGKLIGEDRLINKYNSKHRESISQITTVSTQIPHTIGKTLTTMCRDFDVDLSDATLANGVKAYVATAAEKGDVTEIDGTPFYGTYLVMKPIDYIPSRTGVEFDDYTGVVLRGTPGTTFYYKMGENDCFSDAQTTLSETNLLEGAPCYMHVYPTENDAANTYTCYGLNDGRFKVYSAEGTLAYNKAYLRIPATMTSDAKEVVFGFMNDNVVTGITTVNGNANGNVNDWYTLDGRRLNAKPTQTGVYINNKKKVIIK